MNCMNKVFERLDIQCIREFLLYGCDPHEIEAGSYMERLEISEKAMSTMLDGKFSDKNEREKVADVIYDYANALERVHMEIGLQCGAILVTQLLRIGKDKVMVE